MADVSWSDVIRIANRFYSLRTPKEISLRVLSPTYAALRKVKGAKGQYRIPFAYSHGGGRSSVFVDAQNNTGAVANDSFEMSHDDFANDYAVVRLEEKLLEFAKDAGVIVDKLVQESDLKMDSILWSVQSGLWDEKGSRAKGRINGAPSGSTIVLDTEDQARWFSKDDVLEACDGSGGDPLAALRAGTATVASVDASAKSVTFTAAVPAAWADNDFIFFKGDAANGGTRKGLLGIPAWVPPTSPGATTFLGVNRTVDTDRLGGLRHNGENDGTIYEALTNGLQKVFQVTKGQSKMTYVAMGTEPYRDFVLQLNDKQIMEQGIDPVVGFDRIKVRLGNYVVSVFPDPLLLPDVTEPTVHRAYGLDLSSWEFLSAGEVPHISRKDGNDFLRVSNAMTLEQRIVSYTMTGCNAPGHNINIKLPT